MKFEKVNKIKSSVEIYASKKSTNILDGSYKSIYRGRSLDFDNLRQYAVGDDVKSIDWKATARAGEVLVRQYVAEKKHNILLIFDSGVEMLGMTPSEEEKYKVAAMAAGTIAYLAVRNGDLVAGLWKTEAAGRRDSYDLQNYKSSLMQIEQILTNYEDYMADYAREREGKKATGVGGRGWGKLWRKEETTPREEINDCLRYALRFVPQRSVIFIFTDVYGLAGVDEKLLKQLIAGHDILFVNVKDASIMTAGAVDLADGKPVPEFVERDKKFRQVEEEALAKVQRVAEEDFRKFKISATSLKSEAEVVPEVIRLLERHKYANVR